MKRKVKTKLIRLALHLMLNMGRILVPVEMLMLRARLWLLAKLYEAGGHY